MTVRRFYGVTHVRWELPFPSRLTTKALYCWEPGEGVALLNCLPRVGTVRWRRHSTMVDAPALLRERFVGEPEWAIPNYEYRESSVTSDDCELFTTELLPGTDGGFDEAHAYTIAHLFLCIRQREDATHESVIARAASAINNVFGIHALLTADGWTRPIRPSLDDYSTFSSLAPLPQSWPQLTPTEMLARVSELTFPTEIGRGRTMTVGTGSHEDLLQKEFTGQYMTLIAEQCQRQLELTAYQQLILSAIRRLTRREFPAAIVDAQSAAEVCVSGILRKVLLASGLSEDQIEAEFQHGGVGDRLNRLDRHEKAAGSAKPFGVSDERKVWRRDLEKLRHAVVHRGLREISFEQARAGIAAAMTAIGRLEEIWPQYQPPIRWTGDYLKAEHLKPTAGKLYRLFDT